MPGKRYALTLLPAVHPVGNQRDPSEVVTCDDDRHLVDCCYRDRFYLSFIALSFLHLLGCQGCLLPLKFGLEVVVEDENVTRFIC